MPIFNYKAREMIVKIVYYGPGLCGKTTSLQHLHKQTLNDRRGELYFLATETDQTIYFELLPMYVGEIKNFKLRFQVYTVPGQVKYNNTRKAVLQGVDAIVFVADSQYSRRKANLISFENLKYNLKEAYNILLKDVPLVYEFNKRDMENILSVEELNRDLNPWDLPFFETVATEGTGVLEAFEAISAIAIQNLEERIDSQHAARAKAAPRNTPQPRQAPQPKVSQTPPNETLLEYEPEPVRGPIFENVEEIPEEPKIAGITNGKEKPLSYADIFAVTYCDGEVIFEAGDQGNEMYFIEAGKVKIVGMYKLTEKVIITYTKGDFFGEMILFGGRTRSAKAVAVGTTRLLPVTKETLASQIHRRPDIAIALLKALSNRIRSSTQTIGKLADQNKDLMQRLRKAHDTIKQLSEENKNLKQQ